MLKQFKIKIKEAMMSVLPITLIVILLSFTPILNVPPLELGIFAVSSLILILSIAIFNTGAEIAMSPMGEYIGVGLVKTGEFFVILFVGFLLGLLITISEPDLMVLAMQVDGVIDGQVLIMTVGLGVGFFLAIGIVKIVTHKPLSMFLMLFYMLIFSLVALMCELNKNSLLPLSFDSGGVTTGPMTVPFIMAFGLGIASSIGGKDANENSFGLISLCSIGPIVVVIILAILSKGSMVYEPESYSMMDLINSGIHKEVIKSGKEVLKALGILYVSFLIIQFFVLKLPLVKLRQITFGLVITFIGLVLFLSDANIGFLPMGYSIGEQLAKAPIIVIIAIAFIIGMTVVLAEPAVQVLKKQVEEVTAGAIKGTSMTIALSIGVGTSIVLSVIRQIYGFSLLYYLIPGYFISLMLSLFVPPIYTSIAFDSGGVASGPLTSTFILPMLIGICININDKNSVLSLAFGVVSLVAMTPLITIQLLGFKSIMSNYIRNRIVMKRILSSDDKKIIYFEV